MEMQTDHCQRQRYKDRMCVSQNTKEVIMLSKNHGSTDIQLVFRNRYDQCQSLHRLVPVSNNAKQGLQINSSFTLDAFIFVEYIDDLMDAVAAACRQISVPHTPGITVKEPPVPCADVDKQAAIEQYKSNFF